MRIVNGEHKHIQIKKGDTFIFSSSAYDNFFHHSLIIDVSETKMKASLGFSSSELSTSMSIDIKRKPWK